MARPALRLVESTPHYSKEAELFVSNSEESHSLHQAISFPGTYRSEISNHFIKKYSKPGDRVLDPFCGAGTSMLEAVLLGRVALASDMNPLAVRITTAKIFPADLTEVTLRLQQLSLRRPIDAKLYRGFEQFYDLDTFRELVNLRLALNQNYDRVARFVELVTLSLLHGHTSGYFSVYTFPQIALSVAEQRQLNDRRAQTPDYRAVAPRIIRKTAAILRDGLPSIIRQLQSKGRIFESDPRDLGSIPAGSVNLVVTKPPYPFSQLAEELWLKNWFAGIGENSHVRAAQSFDSIEQWREYMNETLLELARVVAPGGRACFQLKEVRGSGQTHYLDREIVEIVTQGLSAYWDAECTLINTEKMPALKECEGQRDQRKVAERIRILVLRRR